MAVQAYPYLVLSDGSTTVTFADGLGGQTNYAPARGRWPLKIAGIRRNQLGGRGRYADVIEEFDINIRDTTADLCYQRLDTLVRLLDQAERYAVWREPLNSVTLRYAPQGSTVASTAVPYEALVLGRVGDEDLSAVALPATYADAGMIYEIRGIHIRILRRGAWLYPTADNPGASGASANPTVMTRTYSQNHPISSPVGLSIGGFNRSTTPTIWGGLLMVASGANDIQIIEAETMATGVFTSVADAANNARGGSVLRYTPVLTGAIKTAAVSVSNPFPNQPLPFALYAAVRNNGAPTYTIAANAIVGGASNAVTPPYTVDASTTSPRLVFLGTFVATNLSKISLTVGTSATGSTLDIDYLILVCLRDETVSVVAYDDLNISGMAAGAVTLEAQFQGYADRDPLFYAKDSGGGRLPITYRGSMPFANIGDTVYALWTATNGTSGTSWRYVTTAPAVLSVTLTAMRNRAYLSPI